MSRAKLQWADGHVERITVDAVVTVIDVQSTDGERHRFRATERSDDEGATSSLRIRGMRVMTRERRPERLTTFWQLRGAFGRIVDCALYETNAGLELRLEYDGDSMLSTTLVKNPADARRRAERLKRFVIDQGGFEEIRDDDLG